MFTHVELLIHGELEHAVTGADSVVISVEARASASYISMRESEKNCINYMRMHGLSYRYDNSHL